MKNVHFMFKTSLFLIIFCFCSWAQFPQVYDLASYDQKLEIWNRVSNLNGLYFEVGDIKFPVFYFNYLNEENGQIYTIWGATGFLISYFLETVYNIQMGSSKARRPTIEDIKKRHQYLKN